MLIGEYQHTIDAKKRLAIPSKFRRELGERAVVTRGVDACLFVFPLQQWEVLAERIANLPVTQGDSRSFARLMLSGATEVEFDSLGRVLLPDHLKSYAGLTRSVVVAGLYKRLEIWDADAWERTKRELEKNSDRIAEKLGELGGI
ncbi:MAG: division/cell wall cluster transcriptional repressor MraZ [Patescibacteria group bacterium]